MCLALPERVLSVADGTALVESPAGRRRTVSLLLVAETVAAGDYLLVPVGDFAAERLDAASAEASLALLRRLAAA